MTEHPSAEGYAAEGCATEGYVESRTSDGELSEEQYQVLLVFRTALRRYLQWSAVESARMGLTPQQHQLLLAVRAHPGPKPPSIGDLSDYLVIRHHSAVELAKRAEAAGLVRRADDPDDQRVVRMTLTDEGRRVISALAERHMTELQRVSDRLGISEQMMQQLAGEFAQNLLDDMRDNPAPTL
jgi:DNA-binding MarR family transcriptional regulator